MFKTNEFKAFGSIRKTKMAGACGVILALAMLGIAFGGVNVSADEVKPITPATTEVAKPASPTEAHKTETKPASPTETPKPEETVKPVASPDLDSAVKKAQKVGIKTTETEKVGYDTEEQAKADEDKQVKEIDKKV